MAKLRRSWEEVVGVLQHLIGPLKWREKNRAYEIKCAEKGGLVQHHSNAHDVNSLRRFTHMNHHKFWGTTQSKEKLEAFVPDDV